MRAHAARDRCCKTVGSAWDIHEMRPCSTRGHVVTLSVNLINLGNPYASLFERPSAGMGLLRSWIARIKIATHFVKEPILKMQEIRRENPHKQRCIVVKCVEHPANVTERRRAQVLKVRQLHESVDSPPRPPVQEDRDLGRREAQVAQREGESSYVDSSSSYGTPGTNERENNSLHLRQAHAETLTHVRQSGMRKPRKSKRFGFSSGSFAHARSLPAKRSYTHFQPRVSM
ncbi:hypothetical protein BDW02DRAFT_650665 [Decorospora gaudefroyi]|uniref:Uncharacterized protein n=1 Tax=Decorospora gaudefroyi TaxID=184978 RepID=A0A6A5JZ49_9PLEO|nr:hypothetical protein BDW02DRAFT_650665 [Decorospora gaudefroyi]